jgi:hypothetical protein
MPPGLRQHNGIDLLVGHIRRGTTNGYTLTDIGGGFFEPVLKVFYTNTIGVSIRSFVTADLHFVPSGSFANDLMFANNPGRIDIIDIDPSTGFPVLETDPNSIPPNKLRPVIIPFASGFDGSWGLEFDPITNDLFVSIFEFHLDPTIELDPTGKIIQISGFHTTVSIDIKPRHCPNRFNSRSRGRLRVAILGTEYFNVRDIDEGTIKLHGVAPFKPSKAKFKDVTAPKTPVLEDCDCRALDPDTYEDMVLKFDRQKIIETLDLENLQDGEAVPLTLTGNLLDGTRIEGVDCVLIKDKGK